MQSAVIPQKGGIPPPGPVPTAPDSTAATAPLSTQMAFGSTASLPNGHHGHPDGVTTSPNMPVNVPPPNGSLHPQLTTPSYASLSYPSQGGYAPNQGWMYQQQYYAPQPYQPRHYNGHNGNGYAPNRYANEPYPVFPPQGYYPIPQLGGPGPGTMQNGYGAYGGADYPPYMRNAPYPPQQYPPAQPIDQSPRIQVAQPAAPDVGSSTPGPQDGTPYPQHIPQPNIPPGDYGNPYQSPIQSQPSYQHFPPNHPYAHGGGIGLSPGPQAHGALNGHSPSSQPSIPTPMPKKLNPAAAGFHFVPASQRLPKESPSTSSEPAPVFASLSQPSQPQQSSSASVPNGSASTVKEKVFAPVMVNGDKVKEVAQSVVEPDPVPTTRPDLSEKTTEVAAPSLIFTGPPISGYSSPVTSAATPYDDSTWFLASSPADVSGAPGVAFSSTLAAIIPETIRTETLESKESSVPSKTPKRAGRRGAVLALGVSQPIVPKIESNPLAFGELGELTPLPPVAQIRPSAPSIHTTSPSAALEPSPVIEAAVPAPKPKPSSWAGLFQSTTPSSSKTPSLAAFSPSSEAGVLRSSASPLAEPSTPRSGTNTVPSSVSAAPTAQRPVFNYAAAASAGAALSPQDELARLLASGLTSRVKETVTVPRGLINTGNMCFANTVLVYCPPFSQLFEELGKRLTADFARKTPLLEAMIIFLREFAAPAGYLSSENSTPRSEGKQKDTAASAFVPENVYDAMKENKRFDSMRRGYQEDAEEYLGFFLDTLHEELLVLISRSQPPKSAITSSQSGHAEERAIQRPVSPNGDTETDGWLEVGKKQKTNVVRNTETRESAITKVFGGTLRSVLHTPGSKDSVTLEPYQPLQLDIQADDVLSITDALKHLAAPEIVPGVWSATRNANVDATKQVYLESFPQVLILHLKRFVYDGQEQSVVKRSKPLAYGTELVIPPEIISPGRRSASAVKYRLFGVVYHHGPSASGGHYTVAVSRQDGGGWIHFDDETYTTVPTEQVVVSAQEAAAENERGGDRPGRNLTVAGRERCAYLLFYQRLRA